jgi:hypothetical protein
MLKLLFLHSVGNKKKKKRKKRKKFGHGMTIVIVPDHDGGRPMEVNACILITHMVYL